MPKPTCTVDGCELSSKTKGLCNAHYIKHRRSLNLSPPCLVEDCSRPSQTQGYCGSHYNRERKAGRINKLYAPTLEERLWAKVNKDGPTMPHMDTACWEWMASTNSHGYGHMGIVSDDGTPSWLAAHRWSYEHHHGPLTLEKPHVCHRCDWPRCVNPGHLFAGNYYDNHGDKIAKGRQARGEKMGSSKLTECSVRDIRNRYTNGEMGKTLAVEFKVSQATISNIVNRKIWRHLT